jgi:hypothetical protein
MTFVTGRVLDILPGVYAIPKRLILITQHVDALFKALVNGSTIQVQNPLKVLPITIAGTQRYTLIKRPWN